MILEKNWSRTAYHIILMILTFYGLPAPVTFQVRFLSLILDNHLTCVPHIRHLEKTYHRVHNSLRYISWSANPKYLSRIKVAPIRWRCIRRSGLPTHLHLLDPIQNNVISIPNPHWSFSIFFSDEPRSWSWFNATLPTKRIYYVHRLSSLSNPKTFCSDNDSVRGASEFSLLAF